MSISNLKRKKKIQRAAKSDVYAVGGMELAAKA
jgi:hypothetical protein